MLTLLERLSHNALPKNRKRETLDACITLAGSGGGGGAELTSWEGDFLSPLESTLGRIESVFSVA